MPKKISLLLALSSVASAIELTPENFVEQTFGKSVFIKFYTPWCGHCRKLKPDWDRLTADFADSPTQLVAEVNCDGDGKALCAEHGVSGYPALKYGDPAALRDYLGTRTYDHLSEFAKSNLRPACNIHNYEICDDETKAKIDGFRGMSLDELEEAVVAEERTMKVAVAEFEEQVDKIQISYMTMKADSDKKVEEIKAMGLDLMTSVLKSKDAVVPEVKDEL